MSKNEIIEDLKQKIQEGIKEIKTEESFKEYLNFVSKFRNYSSNNVMLIMIQKPTATRVGGFNVWKDLNRFPEKGTAIQILAPLIKKSEEDPNKDSVYGYRYVNVFDVSDTKGEDLPKLDMTINTLDNAQEYIDKLVKLAPNGVLFEDLSEFGYRGYYTREDHSIHIDNSYPINEQLKTLIHELAHSMLHDTDEKAKMSKALRELQAESVAYCIAQMLDWDTSDYSFKYVAIFTKNEDEDTISLALNQISRVVKTISAEILDKDKIG